MSGDSPINKGCLFRITNPGRVLSAERCCHPLAWIALSNGASEDSGSSSLWGLTSHICSVRDKGYQL